MSSQPSPAPSAHAPFFDWALDRWKAAVFLILVAILALGAPRDRATSPGEAAVPPSAPVTASPVALAPNTVTTTATAALDTPAIPATDSPAPSQPTPTAIPTRAPPTVAAEERDPLRAALAIPLPPTISYPPPGGRLPAGSVDRLRGTGPVNSQLALLYTFRPLVAAPSVPHCLVPTCAADPAGVASTQLIENIVVQPSGRWYLQLAEPLPPGRHAVALARMAADGTRQVIVDPVAFTVLDSAEGPPALTIPTIQFPRPAMRVARADIAGSGFMLRGAGLPGTRLRLYLNERIIDDVLVDANEGWELTLDELPSPGGYVARAVALDATGTVFAESAPVAFVLYDE